MVKEMVIDRAICDGIQARSIELVGLERLITFAMSETDYVVPQKKIDELMQKHADTNAEYELLKQQVNNMVLAETNGSLTANWSLDFESGVVTITD